MMILRTKKALIDGREIPEFELNQGELVSLLVDSLEFEFKLKDYFTGEKNHPNIELFIPFTFVEHTPYKVSLLDRLLKRDLVQHLVQKEFNGYSQRIRSILEKAKVNGA
jgi:hypothetical protein